jgi:hypothetical protein
LPQALLRPAVGIRRIVSLLALLAETALAAEAADAPRLPKPPMPPPLKPPPLRPAPELPMDVATPPPAVTEPSTLATSLTSAYLIGITTDSKSGGITTSILSITSSMRLMFSA